MSLYGLPYQGSKNSIAEWVLDHLPATDTLVDLMAGGCAVSHAALMSGKYKHVIAYGITDTDLIVAQVNCNRKNLERGMFEPGERTRMHR